MNRICIEIIKKTFHKKHLRVPPPPPQCQSPRPNLMNLTNIVLMLVHRLQRWLNIKTTLCQCIVLLDGDRYISVNNLCQG